MRPGVIVLKFGGSVLTDEDDLRIAVHEVYRWRRLGWRVVAVVSAFAGRTDALLASYRLEGVFADPHATAAIMACGERESAARLVGCLDRLGVPAVLLDPCAIGLRARGGALDAMPLGFDRSLVAGSLEAVGCVVVPGFFASDGAGRIVTLGRGGSDLTALVVADGLRADRCVLVKDVDGLYEHDPAADGPRPRLFEQASYEDVLELDGSIVQHKAVRFARDRGIGFEVGCAGGASTTRVAACRSVLASERCRVRPTRVALLGLGVVGGGVLELLSHMPDRFECVAACVRDPRKHAESRERLGIALSTDAVEVASSGADVVVEAIGGVETARQSIEAALLAGSHVVTANKAVLAQHGRELQELAKLCGREPRTSAAVGGGTPMLEAVTRLDATSVRGVLNGTANFVLERLRIGETLEGAIAEAQRSGLAEADPSRDLDGRDARDKLRVIAQACDHAIDRVDISRADVRSARPGVRSRQIASLSPDGVARVAIEEVEAGDPLFEVPGEWNAVKITGSDGRSCVVRGRGAGRWPTAEAVIADLLDLQREASFTRKRGRSLATA
ncbi:MAG: hypothetical protein RIE77_10530 [Phycisphaerales bacterium]|jgi:homoserine dehydrogenase